MKIITNNVTYTITDETSSLIKCEHNWKNLFKVSYLYTETYGTKVLTEKVEKEFRTLAEAKKYINA